MSDPQTRLDELIAKLREQGCRLTPQRMAVLEVLATSDSHPSVEQIYDHVKVDFPMTSLATVYKTVTLLKEMGEVLELGLNEGGNRYNGKRPRPHPHLICTNCGRIEDLDVAIVSDLPQEVSQKTGYQIVNHRLDFFGICPQCQGA